VKYLVIATGDTLDSGTLCATSQATGFAAAGRFAAAFREMWQAKATPKS